MNNRTQYILKTSHELVFYSTETLDKFRSELQTLIENFSKESHHVDWQDETIYRYGYDGE